MDEPLLIHSLSSYREIIFRCLELAGARTLCEVGSESGGFTRELADWTAARDGRMWCVEPFPTAGVRELEAERPAFTLVEGLSPAALEHVPACDGWIVDGDHNHHTLLQEVRAITARAAESSHGALIVFHDCGWPWARRDLYYDPSAIPPSAVHPHTWEEGVRPGEPGVVRGGFRGDGQFAVAREEGGPRNGVLTGIEDALAEREGWELHVVPLVFGVGFAFPSSAPWAFAVRDVVRPLAALDLLAAVERNRTRLYTTVLELQDELARRAAVQDRIVADYERRLAEASAELGRLRLERAEARAGAA
jgi:hypothetical protein